MPKWNLGNFTNWQHGRWQWEEDYLPAETARCASKWLDWNAKDGPFFLWVDFFDPHEPWDAPQYLVDRFADPRYKGTPMIHPNYGPASVYTQAELDNMHAHYKAEATLVDKWVGHVLQKIEDMALLDDTMVVFTTDHGIYVGEHNRTGKSNIYESDDRHWPLYEELTHIPFIVYHPKGVRGRRIKGFAQPVDLTMTLLEAGRAKSKAPRDLHGESLLPTVLGKKNKAPRSWALACDNNQNPSIITNKWLFHLRGEGEKPALYERKKDPDCKKNVYSRNKQVWSRLKNQAAKFFETKGATEEDLEIYRK